MEAVDSRPDPGVVIVADSGGLSVVRAGHIVVRAGRCLGAAFGELTKTEVDNLVSRLLEDNEPGRQAPEIPWIAVARRASGEVVAAASTMQSSGVLYCIEAEGGQAQSRIIVGSDPMGVIRSRQQPTELDEAELAAFQEQRSLPNRTPFVDIGRVSAGDTLIWSPHRPDRIQTVEWCGPSTLPAPTRDHDGLVVEYRNQFSDVMRGLISRAGPLITTTSGGLDSTFMTESLVSCSGDRPVQGFCYAPTTNARLWPNDVWIADDLPYARELAAMYPRLRIEPLRNDDRVGALAAAREAFQRSWWPCHAPANQIWLNQYSARAGEAGARYQFRGQRGNASFSYHHAYAAAYYWQHRDLRRFLSLSTAGFRGERTWRSALRRSIAAARRSNQRSVPGAGAIKEETGRLVYLTWLTGRQNSLHTAAHPGAFLGAQPVDPFAARSMIELAASISPRRWLFGPSDRSFARTAAMGRVPDSIRNRVQRGAQGWDALISEPEIGGTVSAADLPKLHQALRIEALSDYRMYMTHQLRNVTYGKEYLPAKSRI